MDRQTSRNCDIYDDISTTTTTIHKYFFLFQTFIILDYDYRL